MPRTGYAHTTTPGAVLLGPAVLYVSGIPHSASRGVRVEFETEWRTPPIAGLSTPIAGLDRVVGYSVRVTGTFLELGPAQIQRMMQGEAGVVAGALTTYSGRSAGVYLPTAGYVEDVTVRLKDGAGNLHAVKIPSAHVTTWPVTGDDRATVGVAVTLDARSTDAVSRPYTYTITLPVATVAITPVPIAVTTTTTAVATVRTYAAGAVEVAGHTVTVVVTNTGIATVSPISGVSPLSITVSGVAVGSTTLTATSAGISGSVAVNVTAGV